MSYDEQLQKIERETQGLQAEFCNALAFWKTSEVQQVSHNLQAASEIISKLGLVPGKSWGWHFQTRLEWPQSVKPLVNLKPPNSLHHY